MALTRAFAGFQLSAVRQVGPAVLSAGLSRFTVAFDVSGFLAGQVVWLELELSIDGGQTFASVCVADFNGPWTDKHGNLQTIVSLTFGLGTNIDGTPQVSGSGWQLRGTLTPVNGPVAIGAGSLSAA